ncbi:MAG: L-2,4-diaminobutyric acid acetyltransferase [marine bacterium B5-7]|nr:MAG: L-2,4-diaminobutyric acid acetyltransferase [marine bacterium B5-7]
MNTNKREQNNEPLNQRVLREPNIADGVAVNRLISDCPPLDNNSTYCNLLQCTHFSKTSCLLELDGEVVGFISAYLLPDKPNTLFVWQVAIAKSARKQGFASKMLAKILQRPICKHVRYLETTITKSNQASWGMFIKFAEKLNSHYSESEQFSQEIHFAGEHDDEHLLSIGPFNTGEKQTSPVPPYIEQLYTEVFNENI